MTYEDFFQKVKEKFAENDENEYYFEKGDDEKYSLKWIVGGVEGGSWNGRSDHSQIEAEAEPSFDLIDEFIEEICPNIKLSQYKALMKDLIIEKEWTDNEYYGNYTHYKKKTIIYKDLYNKMVELNCFENPNYIKFC